MQQSTDEQRPIVRITRFSIAGGMAGRGKNQRAETHQWTIYGEDAEGVERVYAEHTSEEEHQAWRATDPLWREAQRAMFDRLLANPSTRDTVLKINIKAALDAGDTETAIKLIEHLSLAERTRLLDAARRAADDAEKTQTSSQVSGPVAPRRRAKPRGHGEKPHA